MRCSRRSSPSWATATPSVLARSEPGPHRACGRTKQAPACRGPRSAPYGERRHEPSAPVDNHRRGDAGGRCARAAVLDPIAACRECCWRSLGPSRNSPMIPRHPPGDQPRARELRQPRVTHSRLANSVARCRSRRVLLRPCGGNARLRHWRRGHRNHRGRLFRRCRPRRLG